MKTISINLYTIDELREQHPRGHERAHSRFLADLPFFHDEITDALRFVEEEWNSPLAGRFIEWDADRGHAAYEDGSLTADEAVGLMNLFPGLYETSLSIRGGRLEWDAEYASDEAAANIAGDEAARWLEGLRAEMVAAMSEQYRHMLSEEYFTDLAEANEWTFEASGEMRNA